MTGKSPALVARGGGGGGDGNSEGDGLGAGVGLIEGEGDGDDVTDDGVAINAAGAIDEAEF